VLRDVRSVIEQYQAQLPLAIRQIYYVMLGKFGYPKGRQFERRLSYVINRARRARLIDFDHIRDDTSVVYQEQWYADIDHYYTVELERRKEFKRDRSGQPTLCYRGPRRSPRHGTTDLQCRSGLLDQGLSRRR
jgi:hypothetical protein